MSAEKLTVEVTITPRPTDLEPQVFDQLCDKELTRFEQWYRARQKDNGFEAGPLISPERGILKWYLFFAATNEEAPE